MRELRQKAELHDRTALVTDYQTGGRGQGQNKWHSAKGKNLLLSVFKETELSVSLNFMITIVASLSLCRVLNDYNIKAEIKWPNDIYYDNKKLAGILIENSLMRDTIIDSIIGIGFNVNEKSFPNWVPNPISLSKIINSYCSITELLDKLLTTIDEYYSVLSQEKYEELFHEYISKLYRLHEWHLFRIKGKVTTGRIEGVEPDGRLILETEGGRLLHFMQGEIEYVID